MLNNKPFHIIPAEWSYAATTRPRINIIRRYPLSSTLLYYIPTAAATEKEFYTGGDIIAREVLLRLMILYLQIRFELSDISAARVCSVLGIGSWKLLESLRINSLGNENTVYLT